MLLADTTLQLPRRLNRFEQRARVLSIFTLSTMGAGVLGQPVSGFVAGWLGPLQTLTYAGFALLAFVALIGLTTQVRSID